MKNTKIYPVVVKTWIESEIHEGQSVDGYSIHLTSADCEEYTKQRIERQKERAPTGKLPDVYTFPEDGCIIKDVGEEVYQKLLVRRKAGFYGFWACCFSELETPKEKKARLKALKQNALNKLTSDEKEALGLTEK